jgi:hypothetical protein
MLRSALFGSTHHSSVRFASVRVRPRPALRGPLRLVAAQLKTAIARSPGIYVVTGPPGAGKSALARTLVDELAAIGFPVFQGPVHGAALYERLAEVTLAMTVGEARAPVLIRDDAHRLSPATLRALATLFAGDFGQHHAFRAVLIGRPELHERLAQPALAKVQEQVRSVHELPAPSAVRRRAVRRAAASILAGAAAALLLAVSPTALYDVPDPRFAVGDMPAEPQPAPPTPQMTAETAPQIVPQAPATQPPAPAQPPIADEADVPVNQSAANQPAKPAPPAVAPAQRSKPVRDAARSHLRRPAVHTSPAPRAPDVQPAKPAEDDIGALVASLETHNGGAANVQEASMPSAPSASASASPQSACEPYTSPTNFAEHGQDVHGLACRDATGRWWLVNQQSE